MFTMDKIKASKGGMTFYSNHLSCNDYYSENEKVVGHWYGKLASHFGIMDQDVDPEQLNDIGNNMWMGKKMTPGKGDNTRFFDFQCSCQKSVSIMAVIMRDDRLKKAHHDCVCAALSELEKFSAYRLRKGSHKNSNDVTLSGNLMAALYDHDASRALDPQIHTHCVVANATLTEDGNLLALSESEMLKAIRYAGKFYQAAMAKRVRELGYKTRLVRRKGVIVGYEIDGVSDDLLEKYSRRRAEIECAIDEFKRTTGREPTAAEIHVIAKETREAKLKEITTPEVLEQQEERLLADERQQLRQCKAAALEAVRTPPQQIYAGEISKVVGTAIDHVYTRLSVVTKHQILAEALNISMGRIAHADLAQEIDRQLKRLKPETEELLSLYATEIGVQQETKTIKKIEVTKGTYAPIGNIEDVDALDLLEYGKILSPGQKKALLSILQNKDFVQIFRGVAGSGKTTTLQAVHKCLLAAGHRLQYLAPTRGAVNVLKADGFRNATTVAKFFSTPQSLDDKTVLVIDESSLLSNQIGYRLLLQAQAANARILFVGDSKQHTSVEAGDFLRILEDHSLVKKTSLTEIRRQIPENYRFAIEQMAEGKSAAGLTILKNMNAVSECRAMYLEAAANCYLENVAQNRSVILVSPTHAEIETLTDLIRKRLYRQKALDMHATILHESFADYQATPAQLTDINSYEPDMAVKIKDKLYVLEAVDYGKKRLHTATGETFAPGSIDGIGKIQKLQIAPGDRLLITGNDPKIQVTNGDIVTVAAITPSHDIVLTDGRTLPADYLFLSHGYATTSHKSQGRTADVAILAAASLDDRACYVGSSRGRHDIKVFCADYQHLIARVQKNSDRLAVSDVRQE